MVLKFTKMHGLGNDFMVIDAINQSFEPNANVLKEWADRNFGVGFDQLLLVEHSEKNGIDFKYRIFNADGSEVEQCGNGSRCFARFVREKGLTTNKSIKVETASGIITLEMISDVDVRVDMGAPRLEPADIPLNAEKQDQYCVKYNDELMTFSVVSMGNPHAVIEVPDLESAPVKQIGQFLQSHELFPQSVNVGFMQIVDRENIKLRVFERGVGETIACGTGACAAIVAGNLNQKLNPEVNVHLSRGQMFIEWQGGQNSVLMTGPTANVFEGEIKI